ncbi:MAG: DUF2591 domain-containing protein [Burkholderiaceae bacterium]|nr:MAG: DUF2591 domain-containing protein [Burkholderiaceae bacterium]TBR76720.1 MAG: DUF2591 domain-containing protein [Burkholderiaceae bacterium]
MKIKTAVLIGLPLDLAVSQCQGYELVKGVTLAKVWVERKNARGVMDPRPISTLNFSRNPSLSQSIIESEHIGTSWSNLWNQWLSPDTRNAAFSFIGETALVAAMRNYVASKLGDEVDVPDELIPEIEEQHQLELEPATSAPRA